MNSQTKTSFAAGLEAICTTIIVYAIVFIYSAISVFA